MELVYDFLLLHVDDHNRELNYLIKLELVGAVRTLTLKVIHADKFEGCLISVHVILNVYYRTEVLGWD